MEFTLVKIESFIPKDFVSILRDELNNLGVLTTDGCYDYCMAFSMVKGSWRPLEGTNPYMGNTGEVCEAEEAKIEFTCRYEMYKTAVDRIKKIHPYEKPVINVIPLLSVE